MRARGREPPVGGVACGLGPHDFEPGRPVAPEREARSAKAEGVTTDGPTVYAALRRVKKGRDCCC